MDDERDEERAAFFVGTDSFDDSQSDTHQTPLLRPQRKQSQRLADFHSIPRRQETCDTAETDLEDCPMIENPEDNMDSARNDPQGSNVNQDDPIPTQGDVEGQPTLHRTVGSHARLSENSPSSPFTAGKGGKSRAHWDALASQSRHSNLGASGPARTQQQQQRDIELTVHEKRFLLSCERGDIGSARHYVTEFIKENPAFNINCVDPLGRTALQIAIENENIEMIELLLEQNVETGDSLLYAINEENVEAVEILLNHLEKRDKLLFDSPNQGVEINEHSGFTPDITPIMLAAHRDNYEIIKLLLDRNATIPHPHDVRCACQECLTAAIEDSLRLSRSRLNAYRALASPSLICLSQRDPIEYAFELSWELRRLSDVENEFKNEYNELSMKCQKFAVDLLDQTRGSKELEIILNHDTSDNSPLRKPAEGERMQLTRLKMAIQLRQKRFVAHPNCQQLLASIWYEGLPGFRRRNIAFKILLITIVSLSFPFLSIMYLMAPKSTIGQFTKKPFVKFLCHSASYGFFIFLLILASQRINYDKLFGYSPAPSNISSSETQSNPTIAAPDKESISKIYLKSAHDVDRKERRGPPPTPVEWAILAYVVGLIWVEIKQLWNVRIYEYVHNMWNILDFITNSLYLATITLRLIAFIQVEQEIRDGYGGSLARHLPRKHWDAWDPTLISECIFATANIFSSLKLVHIFTVNPHLGPLQISLGRMIIDILKFFFVYSLVLFAFACGLNQLFWYYASMRQEECENGRILQNLEKKGVVSLNQVQEQVRTELIDSCQPKYSSFANLFNSLETLFWSSFGLIDIERFTLKPTHYVNEWFGKTMFGCYQTIAIVVLLNMLIAMMSTSYSMITNQSDVEWKFARSKLWIEYFDDGGTLTSPFNIIPSPKSIYQAFLLFCEKFCRCRKKVQQTKQRSLRLQRILKAVSEREANYQFVMRNLVKRYVSHVQRLKQQSEGVTEDDVNEIKQDISAFRYELLAILKKAGYDTGHVNIAQRGRNRKMAQAERRLMKGFQLPQEPGNGPAGADVNKINNKIQKHEQRQAAKELQKQTRATEGGLPQGLKNWRTLSRKVPPLSGATKRWQDYTETGQLLRRQSIDMSDPSRSPKVSFEPSDDLASGLRAHRPTTSFEMDSLRNSPIYGGGMRRDKSHHSQYGIQQLSNASVALASPLLQRDHADEDEIDTTVNSAQGTNSIIRRYMTPHGGPRMASTVETARRQSYGLRASQVPSIESPQTSIPPPSSVMMSWDTRRRSDERGPSAKENEPVVTPAQKLSSKQTSVRRAVSSEPAKDLPDVTL